jgi:precorrin-3B synthase
MQGLQSTARNLGFWSDVATPASHIATCSGAGACASATYRTKALAAMAADWGCELLDGSVVLHLSGCPKGCAHPAASAIAVVGLPTGFGIVVDGRTTGRPAVVVDEDGLKAALQRVALLVGNTKDAGESAGDCLTRLGSAAIIAALRQE